MSALDNLSPDDAKLLVKYLEGLKERAVEREKSRNKLAQYFPDEGPYRRELYPKSLEHFAAGATHRERALLGGNRSGKSVSGSYESALHATGRYPKWWTGKRFKGPTDIWVAGDTNQTTRDILQAELMGSLVKQPGDKSSDIVGLGTGMIPGDSIIHQTWKPGLPNAIEQVWVKHVSGGKSTIGFKSYDQGREAFQGTSRHVIHLDEEVPEDVYSECLLRTMPTSTFEGGMIVLTFTPLRGITPLIQQFVDEGILSLDGSPIDEETRRKSSKYIVMVSWDDVPHLSEEAKNALYSSIPPYQRDARTKGRPQLGAGAVFPVAETEIVVPPFQIPPHWPRAYGLDVGWNNTAAVWGAVDPNTGTMYFFDEYIRGEADASVHAAEVRRRGSWMPGVVDPAARGRSQSDGRQLLQNYIDLGLHIQPANNAVNAGLDEMWTAMVSGRLKIFSSLVRWLSEFRLYRRDEKGRIVKKNDHLQDAGRYLFVSGRDIAACEPVESDAFADMYVKGIDVRQAGWTA